MTRGRVILVIIGYSIEVYILFQHTVTLPDPLKLIGGDMKEGLK